MSTYFYDEQIKRFLIQFGRILSNWYVTYGSDPQGNPILHRVPIMYGDSSRQAATIIANNSANNLPSSPLITYYISGLEYDQRRTQDPYFVDKLSVRQRTYNSETNEYETTQGNAFTVQRVMPVPYTLRINVDFWTSNYKQKLELIEQLGVLFNPSMELQSTDNFVDWTSLSVVYQDGLTFSSRSIPVGTGNPIDVMSWKFYMPIWLSSPIKVTKYGVIHRIISSIFRGKYREDMEDDDLLLGTRQKITPYGYKILYINGGLQLLPANYANQYPDDFSTTPTPTSTDLYWSSIINMYGTIRPGISMIALESPYMETEIMGTIAFNPNDDRILLFTVDQDTLPQNTLDAVDSVIDPIKKFPGEGLPAATTGQRYLIVNDIPNQVPYPGPTPPDSAWPGLSSGAKVNDIIEYDGSAWTITFVAEDETDIQYVTNVTTGLQYRFIGDGWIRSYEGYYNEGDWRIII